MTSTLTVLRTNMPEIALQGTYKPRDFEGATYGLPEQIYALVGLLEALGVDFAVSQDSESLLALHFRGWDDHRSGRIVRAFNDLQRRRDLLPGRRAAIFAWPEGPQIFAAAETARAAVKARYVAEARRELGLPA